MLTYFRQWMESRRVSHQRRILEEQLAISELTARKRLLESTGFRAGYGERLDPSERLGDGDWREIGSDRAYERTERGGDRTLTEAILGDMRDFARQLYELNAYAKGAIDTLSDFVIGEGYTYRAVSKTKKDRDKGEEDKAQPLVDACQAVIDEFADRLCWYQLEQELFRRSRRDGEYFLRYYVRDGKLDVRTIEPESVRQANVIGEASTFGVVTEPEDVWDVVAYLVQYDENEEIEDVSADDVQHFKANVDRSVKRGLSDYTPTKEALDGVVKLLRNQREGEAVRAAIVGFWQYESASSTAVASHVAGTRDSGRPQGNNPITGKAPNTQTYSPGTIVHVPKSKVFVAPPTSPNAMAQTAVVQGSLRPVGVANGMPEFMVSGDASNADYSSTMIAGSPFPRRVKRLQKDYKKAYLETIWRAVRVVAEAEGIEGYGYDDIRRLVDIQVQAPNPEYIDPLADGQVRQIERINGVLSPQTWAGSRGYDWEEELINQEEYNERIGAGSHLPLPVDAVFPGLGGVAPDAGATDVPDQDQTGQSVAAATNDVRATVGGLTAIKELQQAFYNGELPREAAIANAILMFGFSDEEAGRLFVQKTPEKLADTEPAPQPTSQNGEGS